MKQLKKLAIILMAFLMVCASMPLNVLEISAAKEDGYHGYELYFSTDCTESELSETDKLFKSGTITYAKYGDDKLSTWQMDSTAVLGIQLSEDYDDYIIEYHCISPTYDSSTKAIIRNKIAGTNSSYQMFYLGNTTKAVEYTTKIELKKVTDEENYTWSGSYYQIGNDGAWGDAEVMTSVNCTTKSPYFYLQNSGRPTYFDYVRIYVPKSEPTTGVGLINADGSIVNYYDSFGDALSAAEDGQTVKIYEDVTLADTAIDKNITVDLNGCALTANSLITFAGQIEDSQAGAGLLKVTNDQLVLSNNKQMSVWNATKEGYHFVDVTPITVEKTMDDQTQPYVNLMLKPEFDGNTANTSSVETLLGKGYDASKVLIGVRLNWKDSEGKPHEKDFYYNDTHVAAVYGGSNVFTFSVVGLDGFSGITATPFVSSKLGVVSLSSTVYEAKSVSVE